MTRLLQISVLVIVLGFVPAVSAGWWDQAPYNETSQIDQALVSFSFATNASLPVQELDLYGVTSLCYHCLYPLLFSFNESVLSTNLTIYTSFTFQFQVRNTSNYTLHDFSYDFDEHGVYSVQFDIAADGSMSHTVDVLVEPEDAFKPIYIWLGALLGAWILWFLGLWLYNQRQLRLQRVPAGDKKTDGKAGQGASVKPNSSARVHSLDTFRGCALCVMIFVNYGGGDYWFFNHSAWNGLTVADLVFPWFIFIMGAAIPLSFKALEKKGVPAREVLYKIFRRAVILFGLGLLVINNIWDITMPRIPGVLQRFSISYLVVSLTVYLVPERKAASPPMAVNAAREDDEERQISPLLTPPPGYKTAEPEWSAFTERPSFVRIVLNEFTPWLLQWFIMLSLVFTWLMLTFLVDVPGCGRGYLGPGGIGDFGMYPDCTGGAAGYLDKLVFGTKFIYQSPTCQSVYLTGAYDPEGGLGSLTSIFICWLGVQLGRIVMNNKDHGPRLVRASVWGIVLCSIGGGLCGFARNGGVIPLNKNMWSLSFVLVMAGLGFLVWSLAYVLVDIFKLWNGAPMKYVGMNSIVIYCGHEVLNEYFPLSWNMPIPTHAQVLSSNLIGVICWNLIAFYMFQIKFFINI
eukprot:TRINITY_DN2490_c0_g1_i1.p1 TRINITY_DN2490_c0_g1~~TRINITY_DN2490_c0_g1_i1.p1  ORF type:complete len:629 (-),score=137.35 TRINITY_DN2490_c0_g1_i1:108-1994(-)